MNLYKIILGCCIVTLSSLGIMLSACNAYDFTDWTTEQQYHIIRKKHVSEWMMDEHQDTARMNVGVVPNEAVQVANHQVHAGINDQVVQHEAAQWEEGPLNDRFSYTAHFEGIIRNYIESDVEVGTDLEAQQILEHQGIFGVFCLYRLRSVSSRGVVTGDSSEHEKVIVLPDGCVSKIQQCIDAYKNDLEIHNIVGKLKCDLYYLWFSYAFHLSLRPLLIPLSTE